MLMDIPYVPVQDTPIVLAQAAAPGAAPPPDYILKTCEEFRSAGVTESAMNMVDPADSLATYIERKIHRYVDISAIRNVSLLKDAAHGKISSATTTFGRVYYTYNPAPKYQGNDKAVFMAEYGGSRFRIIAEFHVFLSIDRKKPSSCPPPQMITVKKPALGSSEYKLYPVPASFATSYSAFGHAPSSMTIALRLPPEPKHEGG